MFRFIKTDIYFCNGAPASIATEQYLNNAFTLHCLFTTDICIYISFRIFFEDGINYIGGYRQDEFHGKGVGELVNGDREIAYCVNNRREGKAKYFYKDGREEDRFYKDGKRVG